MSRVLIVATSRKTRGGITSVIKAHETGEQWKKYHCHWVQTHRDGNLLQKVWYFITGFIDFLVRILFYDIVHIHLSQNVSVRRKMIFFQLSKMSSKKVIVHFHAFDTESTIRGDCRDKYKYLFTNADRIIVLSEWWKEKVQKEFKLSDERIFVLYNPCPMIGTSFYTNRKRNILYAGTVNERKGYADLIKAFSKIAVNYKDWKVVFAGNGEIEQGKSLAQKLEIDNQVDFLGWISGEQKDEVFREASIFCLPSYAEGFPMAVLDAWAYGLPVITTPVGGIPDVAEDGNNMLLFTPGDVDKLAEQLDRMITDDALRERITSASIDFAQNKFNIQTINNQIGTLYEELSR